MFSRIFHCLLLLNFSVCPIWGHNYFEGDIITSKNHRRVLRNAVPNNKWIWPNGKIPYVIKDSLNGHSEKILIAMREFQEKTCIEFVERTTEKNYLEIQNREGNGCASRVGFLGSGAQPVSLEMPKCSCHGVILHELMHSIGFYHLHTRTDRDDYLEIHIENIARDNQTHFSRLRAHENQILVPFDFDSVMLYGNTTFSIDKSKMSMSPKDKRFKLLDVCEKPHLSCYDVVAINKLYQCPPSYKTTC